MTMKIGRSGHCQIDSSPFFSFMRLTMASSPRNVIRHEVTVSWAATEQMKAFHVMLLFQKLMTSSWANSTPPIGALNTAEIPAAIPAVTRSRCSCSKLRPRQA